MFGRDHGVLWKAIILRYTYRILIISEDKGYILFLKINLSQSCLSANKCGMPSQIQFAWNEDTNTMPGAGFVHKKPPCTNITPKPLTCAIDLEVGCL